MRKWHARQAHVFTGAHGVIRGRRPETWPRCVAAGITAQHTCATERIFARTASGIPGCSHGSMITRSGRAFDAAASESCHSTSASVSSARVLCERWNTRQWADKHAIKCKSSGWL
eukprot:5042644-Prymnesium_polylepis.1